jgi:hypothetical protein
VTSCLLLRVCRFSYISGVKYFAIQTFSSWFWSKKIYIQYRFQRADLHFISAINYIVNFLMYSSTSNCYRIQCLCWNSNGCLDTEQQEEVNTGIYKLLLKNAVHVTSVMLLTSVSKQLLWTPFVKLFYSHRQGQSSLSSAINNTKRNGMMCKVKITVLFNFFFCIIMMNQPLQRPRPCTLTPIQRNTQSCSCYSFVT